MVDFSCGANVWVPMLKDMCLEAGIVSVHPQLLPVAPLHESRVPVPLHANSNLSWPGDQKQG